MCCFHNVVYQLSWPLSVDDSETSTNRKLLCVCVSLTSWLHQTGQSSPKQQISLLNSYVVIIALYVCIHRICMYS